MQTGLAFIKTLRLHQWTKNLLVFAALIFSQNLGHGEMVWRTVLAFLAFCFLSSSVYVINDILDAERDRAHPVKRFRPIASGKLKPGIAFFGALFLLALAGLIAWRLDGGPPFLKVLGGYFLLNLAYSLFLKKMVVADVIIIAFGFLLRVAAGGLIISVALSHWLIMCTFFVATMLACCKRRAELASAGDSKEARAVLTDYSLPLLDLFITMSASATLMAYALYTVSDRTIAVFHTTHLIYTVPLVMYGMGRYLFLVYRKSVGEDPAATLIKDPGLIIAVLLWLAMTYILLYGAQ